MESQQKECCGILVSSSWDDDSWHMYQLSNISDDPTTGYHISPEDAGQVVTHHELVTPAMFYDRALIWHTHPGGMVGPSKLDLETMALHIRYLVMTIPTREVVKYERCQ